MRNADRTADGSAELVVAINRLAHAGALVEVVVGVECGDLVVLESAAVIVVAARFRDDVGHTAGGVPVGGVGFEDVELDFRGRIDRRRIGWRIVGCSIGRAIEQNLGVLVGQAPDREARSRRVVVRMHGDRARRCDHARGELHEAHRCAAIQRKVLDLLLGEDLPDGRVVVLQQRRVRRDFNRPYRCLRPQVRYRWRGGRRSAA